MKTNNVSSITLLAIAITIAGVSTLVLACGSSYPSESAGRKYLEAQNHSIKVKSFTKTNGREVGAQRYILEYKGEFECQGPWFKCTKVGDVFNESGEIEFQKTENGWRAPDGKIY